jgi:cell division initiation protein
MKIAPIDIAHKSFTKKIMGVDSEEVAEFLRSVADELEAVIKERNQLKETVRERELSILEYRERDKMLKDTIITAQKMTEKIKEEAEREARIIVSDAEQRAEGIVRDSRDGLKRVYREISELQRIRAQFETNLKAVVESHLSLMEQQQRFSPAPNLGTATSNIDFTP